MRNMIKLRTIVYILLLLDQCSSECEEEGNIRKSYVPAQITYDDKFIDGHYTEITLGILMTCREINLPLTAVTRNYSCEDCPKILKILNTQIPEVPSSAFLWYSDFNILYLENLGIKKILPVAFYSLNSLKELYLSQNKLVQLMAGVFNSLIKLEILDLSNNEIKDVGSHCFTGTVNLKFLNLSFNNLVIFSDSILDKLTNHMQYLDLSFNNISEISTGSVMQVVDTIDLSNNQISKLIDGLFNVKNVNVSRNKLKNLKVEHFSSNLLRITHLDVGYNEISQLNSNFSLPLLQTLNLDHNNISKIPLDFFSFNYLEALNLSYNQLEQLHHGTFDRLENLKILDISHNKLERIEEYLHSLSNLTELNINSNKLDNLNSKQLLEYLPNLSELSIENNNFTCTNLTHIVHDFRRNNVLIPRGHTSSNTNILGIACYDNSLLKTTTVSSASRNVLSTRWKESSTEIPTENRAVMDYFNKDFVNSNYYKYMENFSHLHPFKIEESSIYKYFNEDFKKSKFFEYIENFKDDRNDTVHFQEFFDNFSNSNFVKYLANLKNNQEFFNAEFKKSMMYKFFNQDFKNSEFYKYSHNLSCPLSFLENSEYGNSSNYCNSWNNNYGSLSITITILLVIMVFLLLIQIFVAFFLFNKKKYSRNEQIELIKD